MWELEQLAELFGRLASFSRLILQDRRGTGLSGGGTFPDLEIVESTDRLASIGDRAWADLLLQHHALVRAAISRWGGRENDTAADGFYATFDGPARAIRCALDIVERIRSLGLEIRVGIHAGELESVDGKYAGLAVAVGVRITAAAGTSEVLISRTVKDLTAGSGSDLEDRGMHELKGVGGDAPVSRPGLIRIVSHAARRYRARFARGDAAAACVVLGQT